MTTIELFGLALLMAWVCDNMSKEHDSSDDYDEPKSIPPLERHSDIRLGYDTGDNVSNRESNNFGLLNSVQQDTRRIQKLDSRVEIRF